jgi:hypothetical protein
MDPRRVLVRRIGALACASLAAGAIAGPASAAVTAPDRAAASRALAWVASQQQDDGGFELAGGFLSESIEAVLAMSAAAQTTDRSSAAQAARAVHAVATDEGLTALDYLDDLADATGDDRLRPATAAKMIAAVTAPLCLDPAAFDPQADGATDLVARMQELAGDDGAYAAPGELNATLYAVLALASIGDPVPAAAVSTIRDAQKPDGSYHYSGDPSPSAELDFDDFDTTSVAIQALLAARVDADDPAVADAVTFLADRQNDDGSWDAFGSPDPNATAISGIGLRAAGVEPEHDDKAWLRDAQGEDGRVESPADSFGVNTYATTQAIRAWNEQVLPVVPSPDSCGGQGYYLFAADGGVFTFGASAFYGSAGAITLNSPIVGGAVTPTGRGYHLFAADGGVFTFGDGPFLGSMGAVRLNSPIVGGASTPTGRGYYLFAADGGVFTFGDASFFGSMGATRLNQPIVAATVTPSGDGYVLIAGDGGVFTFGDAPFAGSLGAVRLNQPIVGGSTTPTGEGYLMFARDGGVFTFGDGEFFGSLGAVRLNQPIVAGSPSFFGEGYAMFAADGGVFTFGDFDFAGSAGSIRLNSPIVGGAVD